MKTKSFKPTAKTYNALYQFAHIVQNGTLSEINKAYIETINNALFASKGWQDNFNKFGIVLDTHEPQFSIFAKSGNSKLPFISFSSLPAVTCPGAGDCLDFCYSFSAWRYPAAIMRQLQNAFLLRFNKPAIVHAFNEFDSKATENYDVRLYVDGDFSSVSDVAFWFDTIRDSKARVYGYSKSFAELLQYDGEFPANYVLNISSGHSHDDDTIARVKALPITRGEFIAVNLGRKIKSDQHGTVEINKALREKFGKKAFTCPGSCGSCTGKGHACGMQSLKGLPIIIAVH